MSTTIERHAKLFEAGSYPDRGIEITEDDLDRIAESTAEAPIRIEHTSTPFDGALGVLKSVYRKGRELFGKLCFTQAAWELVKAANARRLSVAIKKDLSGIAEVSLVREPRIADAAVFSEENVTIPSDSEITLESDLGPQTSDFGDGSEPATSDLGDQVARLRRQLIERDADSKIDELKRAGKLAPAAEVFARAILTSGDSSVITFGGSATPVSEVFLWFLQSQPKVIEFAELATAKGTPADEPELFTKLGITTDQVDRHRSR